MLKEITKRPYVRLTPAQWAGIVAQWQTGEFTLAQLSHQHGVTGRAIQLHLAKNNVTKGSEAKAVAAKVKAKVYKETLPDVDTTSQRAIDIREAAYRNSVAIEGMIVQRLEEAAADPEKTFSASAAIKMLGVAAAALERLHALKRNACGISDDDAGDTELPVLQIQDLTAAEITDLQRNDGDDDPGDLAPENDVVMMS